MAHKNVYLDIRNLIAIRMHLLTNTERNIVDQELEFFESHQSSPLPINELAVLIATSNKPIYKDVEVCIRRCHEVAGLGCLSSCLSSSPIVTDFWEYGLLGPGGTSDNLIVGRGHIAPTFYAIRYCKGFFPLSFLLSVHGAVPAVVNKEWGFANTMRHSLGEGIAMSIGKALSGVSTTHNYCFAGDGELNEGICFEAIRIAYEHDIKRYTLIVDDNEAGIAKCEKPLNLKYLDAYFDRIHVMEVCENKLLSELDNCTKRGLREVIVCKTQKGPHSYNNTSSSSKYSICSEVSNVLARLSHNYPTHIITPDMAGRFGLVEELEYINTGLAEQASVAMTMALPMDEVKFILSDDKFFLNSIDCIQSAMLSVKNLQIVAARKNDVWGGPVSAPNILTSMGNIKVYELCDSEIFEEILRERVRQKKNTIYLLSDQNQKSIKHLKAGYMQIDRDFLFKQQVDERILLVSTESFASKVGTISEHHRISHLRVLCRRPAITDQMYDIINRFETMIVYENNAALCGLGEYLQSLLLREVHIISVDNYETPAIRKIQEKRSLSSIDQLMILTEGYINV